MYIGSKSVLSIHGVCLLSPVSAASEDHRNPNEDIDRVQVDSNRATVTHALHTANSNLFLSPKVNKHESGFRFQ